MHYSIPKQMIHCVQMLLASAVISLAAIPACSAVLLQAPSGGQSVLPAEALLTTPVDGLSQTGASAQVVPVTDDDEPFSQALQVTIHSASATTNATQLTMRVPHAVAKGDVLLATFYLRGAATGAKAPAEIAFLFERSQPPWRSSISQNVAAARSPSVWKKVVIPFAAAEDYAPNLAMVSLRFAFGPQTVDVGGLSVVDYHQAETVNALTAWEAQQSPLGSVTVTVSRQEKKQKLLGLGGDFCQPRYGSLKPMDAVGSYVLDHLAVAQARVGIPLNIWAPMPGTYQDKGAAHAALLQMQILAKRHIPIIGTVWEGPKWMLPGKSESSGRILPPSQYASCIAAIAQFLVTARDQYGVTVADFSFNEPNYGVNFLFTPQTLDNFIRQAGPRFRALGLKTKFLVGDTTGGMPLPAYARPLLTDPTIAPFLGPIAFHCWDVLGMPSYQYRQIAALGHKYHKSIWCTEAGYDSQLWQAPNPWGSWENGLQTAHAYVKTLSLTGAATMDYWTYENNYPLVNPMGTQSYPVFSVIQQMQQALPVGGQVVKADSGSSSLHVLATVGPKRGSFSLLLVNMGGTGTVTAVGLPPDHAVRAIVSAASGQERMLAAPSHTTSTGHFTFSIPPRSVVTILAPG